MDATREHVNARHCRELANRVRRELEGARFRAPLLRKLAILDGSAQLWRERAREREAHDE
jgi:hypothetical protein